MFGSDERPQHDIFTFFITKPLHKIFTNFLLCLCIGLHNLNTIFFLQTLSIGNVFLEFDTNKLLYSIFDISQKTH